MCDQGSTISCNVKGCVEVVLETSGVTHHGFSFDIAVTTDSKASLIATFSVIISITIIILLLLFLL